MFLVNISLVFAEEINYDFVTPNEIFTDDFIHSFDKGLSKMNIDLISKGKIKYNFNFCSSDLYSSSQIRLICYYLPDGYSSNHLNYKNRIYFEKFSVDSSDLYEILYSNSNKNGSYAGNPSFVFGFTSIAVLTDYGDMPFFVSPDLVYSGGIDYSISDDVYNSIDDKYKKYYDFQSYLVNGKEFISYLDLLYDLCC